MSSSNQGRQSPTPDSQSDSQTGRTSGGQGVNDNTNNQETSKKQLDVRILPLEILALLYKSLKSFYANLKQGLESNPKPILEDHLKDATKKTEQQKKD